MPWYRTGTVAITAGQTTVTGTNTNFSANARVGDAFQGPDGRWYEVTNIASGTVLSILPAYQGSTVAGGTYGLAPMQGYVKESADRLRQIVDQWGSTLAGLGSVSTENVVPVAKGGTGGTTAAAARAGLNLGSAAVAAIVGELSQTGGVPTGALMQQVTNSVGTYWKFACGLMISSQKVSIANGAVSWATGTGVRYVNITAGLPVAFVSPPDLYGQFYESDISARSAWITHLSATSGSALNAWFGAGPATTGSGAFSFNVLAVGRWF